MAPSHALRSAINGHIRERLAREGTIHGSAFQGEGAAGARGHDPRFRLPGFSERLVSHGYPSSALRPFGVRS